MKQQPVDEAQWRSAEKDLVVRVQWNDGTEGEVNGWTSQWTKSHICVVRESAPPYTPFWVRASDARRR
jgi:hypothetical protein